MNILFTYITPFHPNKGGIGRVTHELTLELLKRSYKVYYLIYKCGITVQHEYDYPAPLTYLPSSDCLSKENIEAYHSYLQENKIDVIINQSGNFSDSQLWLNTGDPTIKVISVIHTPPWVSYKYLWHEIYPLRNNSLIEKFKRIARVILYPKIKYRFRYERIEHYQKMLPLTDYVCTLSSKFFSDISEICPGYESKYRAIPNPNSYRASDIEPQRTQKKNQLLWVGLFCSEKNPILAVKIWRHLYHDYPNWEFVIVGYNKDGYWRECMESLAKDIPNIRFVGYQDPLTYQLESRIACLTSTYEGWGMVLTEAMQCGAVPIAFNSFASVSDIIEDGHNGLLIKPFSVRQYVKGLKRLMDSPELLNQMAKNAKHDIEKYAVEKVVDQWENLFHECSKKR